VKLSPVKAIKKEGGEKLKEETLNMRSLLSKKERHLLWKDELGDDFIILKYAEVYRYSKKILRVCCWSRQKAFQLIKKAKILAEDRTDDLMYYLDVNIEELPLLISLGAFKRRPNIHGKWIKGKEEELGHKINVYEPIL